MAKDERELAKLEQDIQECRKTRKWLKWGGITILVLNSLLLVADCTTRWPTPNRGEFAGLWITLMILGGGLLLQSRKLPLKAALQVAEKHGGKLAVHELVNDLDISIEVAEATLKRLCEKCLATSDYTTVPGSVIYDFELIRARLNPSQKSQFEQLSERADQIQEEQARRERAQQFPNLRGKNQNPLNESNSGEHLP